jgi:hypothetical protein
MKKKQRQIIYYNMILLKETLYFVKLKMDLFGN